MGTRSTIALEFADGTVEQVYCHWDGYLDHNGQILLQHYMDPFKLRDLIDLGDMSSLRKDIGEKHVFSKFDLATQIEQRLHDESTQDMCTFYGRDRGEKGTGAKKFKDFADYAENHQREEYEYILRTDGKWYVSYYKTGSEYVELETACYVENMMEEVETA
jgi:hypothetical protein